MIGLLIGGRYWVSTHLIKLYPVLLEGQEVGYAFDQKVIEQYKDEVLNRCQKQYPGLEPAAQCPYQFTTPILSISTASYTFCIRFHKFFISRCRFWWMKEVFGT
ncbi:hypothetical protein M5W68_16910 [Paenibacillus larvae]|uniref:hypothetical protein n=1 Tax=Paenibacillus larvae TaxID=1464 RepID=UPI00227FFEC2|nr:hypothetical protein [Paenibacillus larvae]MCY9509120.1 hypothetical protein [Paenibacillus larvae]MCY9526745.1 hypothetical protein [Paenibacillus larvae]